MHIFLVRDIINNQFYFSRCTKSKIFEYYINIVYNILFEQNYTI